MAVSSSRFTLTAQGKHKYEEDLTKLYHYLQKVARRMRHLRRRNNLEEDGDWEYVQNQYDYATKRIDEIETVLENSHIITTHKPNGTVELGSKVRCRSGSKSYQFILVDPVEANPEEGKISTKSPLGKELLGKRVNDEIHINPPAGPIQYNITAVS